jgi:hypothetical protein
MADSGCGIRMNDSKEEEEGRIKDVMQVAEEWTLPKVLSPFEGAVQMDDGHTRYSRHREPLERDSWKRRMVNTVDIFCGLEDEWLNFKERVLY